LSLGAEPDQLLKGVQGVDVLSAVYRVCCVQGRIQEISKGGGGLLKIAPYLTYPKI